MLVTMTIYIIIIMKDYYNIYFGTCSIIILTEFSRTLQYNNILTTQILGQSNATLLYSNDLGNSGNIYW